MHSALKILEHFMAMDDHGWECQATSWVELARLTMLPRLIPAMWSRIWGGSRAWLAETAAIACNWVDPRLFGAPITHGCRIRCGFMNEHICLDRAEDSPVHDTRAEAGMTA